MDEQEIKNAIISTLISPHVDDRNGEAANVVDVIDRLARYTRVAGVMQAKATLVAAVLSTHQGGEGVSPADVAEVVEILARRLGIR